MLGQSLPGIGTDRGSAIRFGKLSLEGDDPAIGREADARFTGIPRDERANRPYERRDVLAANERVQRIVAAAGELDECAQRVLPLEPDSGSRAGGSERVGAKE